MESDELQRQLIELAREVGLEVRVAGRACFADEPPPSSSTCRVRGRTWVVLAQTDPVELRLAVLCRAIRGAAGASLDGRYLSPALRERLSAPDP